MPHTSSPSPNAGLNMILFTIPQSAMIQAGTASIVLVLLTQKAATETLQALGQASEELFRGSMLPILNFPDQDHELNPR